MKEVPFFIKFLRDFFWDVKTKGRDSSRVYKKILIMHDLDLGDLIEIIKEEMSKFKLFVKKNVLIKYLIKYFYQKCIKYMLNQINHLKILLIFFILLHFI